MKGMSRSTGRAIFDELSYPEHLYQSIHDILTTLIGTRLCRRKYGSLVPHLIDQPCNEITQLKLMNASATAIIRFEPRVKISQVMVSQYKEKSGYWEVTVMGTQTTDYGSQAFLQEHIIGAAA